jgi:hypothetical protein
MSLFKLGFEATVRKAFDFLVSKFRFKCETCGPTLVTYLSSATEVEITLDPRSYEVGVELKRRGTTRSFPLHRVIELSSPEEAREWRLVQTSNPARVKEFVPKLASLLGQYGELALRGDPSTFQKLEKLEESDAMRTTRDFQISEARRLAEHEWQCRNYSKVVSLLSPVQEELTDSEFARFVYAKRRLAERNRGEE